MPGSKLSRQHFISLNLITSWQEVCKMRFSTKFSDRKRMGNQHKTRHNRRLYQSAVNSSSRLANLLKMNIIVIFYKKHLYMLQKMLSFASKFNDNHTSCQEVCEKSLSKVSYFLLLLCHQ